MSSNGNKFAMLSLLGVTVILGVGTETNRVSAHSGATGIVKQRMDTMKSIADAMKQVGQQRNASSLDAEVVKSAMREIIKNSDAAGGQFPHGEFTPPSEALPIIHDEWNKFSELLSKMRSSAQEIELLAQTANSFSDIEKPFQELAATCKSCHERYRLKK